jgi:hypothetical protein
MDSIADTKGGSLVGESSQSAVSWAAIIAGAVVALAVALLLVTLGTGLGLASLSPWPGAGATATTFGISTGIGLIVVHWVASAGGGFVTGRLRTKWAGVHTHEVFFRDTAHGLLSWALATLIGVSLVASGVSSVINHSVAATASIAGGAAQGAVQAAPSSATMSGYDVDSLFRSTRPDATANSQTLMAETAHILAVDTANGNVPDADRAYLTQLVSAKTGLSTSDAQARVDGVIAREKQAVVKARDIADAARKAGAVLAIFTALAMLIGAFIASVAAAYGGNLRDEY